jgi:hypothetical protein
MGICDPALEHLLLLGCSKEVRSEVELVKQLFLEFRQTELDENDLYDCVAGLSYCETLIQLLEQADVPDALPLLRDIREYMSRFLPTYTLIVGEISRASPGHPYSTADSTEE